MSAPAEPVRSMSMRGTRHSAVLNEFRNRIASRAGGKKNLNQIHIGDPRFGGVLLAICESDDASLGNLLCGADLIKYGIGPQRLRIALTGALHALDVMQRMTLGEELDTIVNGGSNNTAVCYRLGLYGNPKMTLEAAGQLAGVTRERIRQKEAKLKKRLSERRPFTPVLNRALAVLDEHIARGICNVPDIETAMHSMAILGSEDNLRQILTFAELLGVERYTLIDDGVQASVLPSKKAAGLNETMRFARRFVATETRSFGACSVEALKVALEQAGHGQWVAQMPLILGSLRDIEWLEEGSWLRSTTRRAALLTPAMKVLSVSPTIRLSDLKKGLQRSTRRVGLVPQKRILAAILLKDLESWRLRLEGDVLIASRPASPENTLSAQERLIYNILQDNDRVMSRADLERAAKARGINLSSFHVALRYWPILECYTKGVYGLRGTQVQPGIVEALAPREFKRVRALKDYGHLADGRIWVDMELTQFNVDYAILSQPAALKNYLSGTYAIRVAKAETNYECSVSVGQFRMLGHFLNASGAEVGDHITLVFDSRNHSVDVSLGDEDVVEELTAQSPP